MIWRIYSWVFGLFNAGLLLLYVQNYSNMPSRITVYLFAAITLQAVLHEKIHRPRLGNQLVRKIAVSAAVAVWLGLMAQHAWRMAGDPMPMLMLAIGYATIVGPAIVAGVIHAFGTRPKPVLLAPLASPSIGGTKFSYPLLMRKAATE